MFKKILFHITLFVVLVGCIDFTDADAPTVPGESSITGTKQIDIELIYDADDSGNDNAEKGNVYVMWLENSSGVKQHLYICEKLRFGGITNYTQVLPYWHLNKYPESNWVDNQSEIDTVTGATIAQDSFSFPDDFTNRNSGSVPNTISSTLGDVFTLYVEMDQSCQFNDWFDIALPGAENYSKYDEPAVLYSVEINLNNLAIEQPYTLTEVGWTPHVDFVDFTLSGGSLVTLPAGVRNNEMRYITHDKVGGVFGSEKLSCSSTSLIDSIKATITDVP